MRKIRLIAVREFTVTVRRPAFLLLTTLFPLIGVVGVLVAYVLTNISSGRQPQPGKPLGYVDQTGLFNDFQEQGQVRFVEFPDQPAGVEALTRGEIDNLYVIPRDYLSTGAVIAVQRQRAGVDLDEGTGTGPLQSFLLDNLVSGKLSDAERARVHTPVNLARVEVDAGGQPARDQFAGGRFLFFLGLGALTVIAMFMTSSFLLQGLSEEKENRVIEILLSSVTPAQLMVGKLVGLCAVGLAQVAAWVASGLLIVFALVDPAFDLPPVSLPSPPLVLAGLAYFLLGYAFFGGLLGALGAVTSTHREANQITFIFVLPGVIPFYVMTQLMTDPNGALARTLSLIPFTAPLTMMVRMALDAAPVTDILLSLAVLAASVAVIVLMTLRLFRAYLLSYGQRPSLRSIARTLVRG